MSVSIFLMDFQCFVGAWCGLCNALPRRLRRHRNTQHWNNTNDDLRCERAPFIGHAAKECQLGR